VSTGTGQLQIDSAGNVGAPAGREFTVDTLAPTTTIGSGPQGLTNNASPSFGFDANEAGSSYECRLDGGAFAACSSPTTHTDLADGPHVFQVRATDQIGHTEPNAATRSFTVDTKVLGTASAKKAQLQKRSRIKLKVRLGANETLAANGTGKIKLGQRFFRLKPKTTRVAAGKAKTLTLVPKRRSNAKRIAKALKRGTEAKATPTLTLTDAAANSNSHTLVIKLKR